MKVLITGSQGQLGKAIISNSPASSELIITSKNDFDLSDLKLKRPVKELSNEEEISNKEKKESVIYELKQLKNKNPMSCKDVTFRLFGLSLATINTVISILLSGIMIRVINNYGKN